MVIIRESNDEGGFDSIPPLGSATERQIYSQSIRWDRSFDEDKYCTEMLNLPIIDALRFFYCRDVHQIKVLLLG
jgi:hypothetical protein